MNVAALLTEESADLATYAYSYPHKSSYRPLLPPARLTAVWQDEDVHNLSLYVHIPFCEMRCGFCNLFTQSQPGGEIVDAYLATLRRQMRVIRRQLPSATFNQLAVGGGTPTFLSSAQLEYLLQQLERTFHQPIGSLATSIETSPATATKDRLQTLADFGVTRVSLGVQSFVTSETRRLGRPQRERDVFQALETIRDCGFPVLNIDLIYGDQEQTRASWLASLKAALRYMPEELYLYPLYIRPGTGLARARLHASRHRADLYRAACELLTDRGYVQTSLRNFRRGLGSRSADYGCQRDGMIGLGCGARSYTRRLHYATRFAVTQAGIRAILGDWISQTDDELAWATHGVWLSDDEQLRRFLILSLLPAAGMAISEFQDRFPSVAIEAIPGILALMEREWLARVGDRYLLTASGLQNSDTVAPLLYSPTVRERLRSFTESPDLIEAVRQ